jgi:cell division septal protein FtsQ
MIIQVLQNPIWPPLANPKNQKPQIPEPSTQKQNKPTNKKHRYTHMKPKGRKKTHQVMVTKTLLLLLLLLFLLLSSLFSSLFSSLLFSSILFYSTNKTQNQKKATKPTHHK